ncbi:hypothetical protein C8Q77DRAFT_1073964 [Trametes polyzona]|nr:hypothetical protein C8Q77DRAFT_1073964 [Trametes polyzona]
MPIYDDKKYRYAQRASPLMGSWSLRAPPPPTPTTRRVHYSLAVGEGSKAQPLYSSVAAPSRPHSSAWSYLKRARLRMRGESSAVDDCEKRNPKPHFETQVGYRSFGLPHCPASLATHASAAPQPPHTTPAAVYQLCMKSLNGAG